MRSALSTVAMNVYNLLAAQKRPCSAAHLVALYPEHEQAAQVPMALEEMLGRGWLRLVGAEYDLRDAKRRLVRVRDRSDGQVVNGQPIGGWEGWRVQCRRRGLIPIADAIAEAA